MFILQKLSILMKTRNLYSVIVAFVLTATFHLSFGQKVNFDEKEVGHVYHVSIPSYMTKTNSLNTAASLQYLNAAKETYVIVIEDSKEQLLDAGIPFNGPTDFFEHFESSFADQSSTVSPIDELKINGNPAVQVEITKPFGDYKVCYLVTVIESESHFYKMLAWTIEDYKERYMADFKKIAESLREDS